jgi:DNA-binding PadR family transcriptional regulator
MFRDHSLVPAEAIRLAALGLLAEAPRRYADLAAAVRHFTGRIVGPSLDLMGTSLELLRYEGLAETADTSDDPPLRLTPAGRAALAELLRAGLRAPVNDLARLGLVLKLRFLHHLPEAEQVEQLGLVIGAYEQELARLEDLRATDGAAPGLFRDWLEHDIGEVRVRIAWLARRRGSLAEPLKTGAGRP